MQNKKSSYDTDIFEQEDNEFEAEFKD